MQNTDVELTARRRAKVAWLTIRLLGEREAEEVLTDALMDAEKEQRQRCARALEAWLCPELSQGEAELLERAARMLEGLR